MKLASFISGALFAQYGIPLLDGITTWFLSWIEVKKARQSEIINQININMHQAAASADQDPPMRKIGFCVPDDSENNTEEEDSE